jgi:hypothetical protein
VTVTLYDEQAMAGFVISSASGNTSEDFTQATFTIQTTTMPFAEVTVSIECLDMSEGLVSPLSLTFPTNPTAVDPQTVTVTGMNDFFADGDIEYRIKLTSSSASGSYNGLEMPEVILVNEDND